MTKFGLALGGGGARGLAHIGVLKALESENIKIDAITGCSMGAVIGGLYAYFGNAEQVEQFVFDTINSPKFIRLGIEKLSSRVKKSDKNYVDQFFEYVGTRILALKALKRLSYFDNRETDDIFEIIPDVSIENLAIRFSSISTDLLSGQEINFTSGSLRDAIKASAAIPGIFPPVQYQKYLLVDGSASESVPAGKLREIGANRVLAVDVTQCIKTVEPPQNAFEILYRAEDITSFHLSLLRLKEADFVIRPNVRNLGWADFKNVADIILAGEKAVKENMSEIKKLVHRNSYLLELEHYLKKLKG